MLPGDGTAATSRLSGAGVRLEPTEGFLKFKQFATKHGVSLAVLLMFFLSVGSLLKSPYVDMKRKNQINVFKSLMSEIYYIYIYTHTYIHTYV